jgi:hypothetical protein
MSERRIQELLKEKQVYDSYRKERAKRGDREMKSTSDIKDDAQKNVLKESIITNKLDTTVYEEPKPEQELGESIYDYYARLEEWTERANKIEEMKNLAINQELIKERDRLRKNFKRIMTPGEAQQMMIKVDDGNIMKLNKYWAGFEKKLRDQFSNIDFDTLEEFIYKYIDIVENGGDQLSMLKNISQDVKSMKTDYESISNSIGTLQEGFKDANVEIKDVIKQAVKTGNKKLIKAVESVNTNVNDSYNKLSQLAKNRDSMTEEQMTRELSKLTETIMKSSANIEKMISDSSEMANSNQASIYENLITIVNELAMGFENINEKLDDNQDEITAAINQSVDTYAEIINHIQSNQADESEYQRKLNEKLDNVIEAFTPSKSKIPT